MVNIRKLILPMLVALCTQAAVGQVTNHQNSLKLGVLNGLNNNFALEYNRNLSAKSWAVLRLGITDPTLEADTKFIDGFFLKAGYRLYPWGGDNAQEGFYLQPTLVYNWWKNRAREGAGRFSNVREISMGGLVEVGYSFAILDRMRLEPFAGIGVVPSWTSYTAADDTPPFEDIEVTWEPLFYDELVQPSVSHLPLNGDLHLAFSAGLNFGVLF